MFFQLNELPKSLASAVKVAVVVGWLHVVASIMVGWYAASLPPGSGGAGFIITFVILFPGVFYLCFAGDMVEKRRWTVIATLGLAALEAGALALIIWALWFGMHFLGGTVIALACLGVVSGLILSTTRALWHWQDEQQPGGFAVLPPQSVPATKLPPDAECDQGTEP